MRTTTLVLAVLMIGAGVKAASALSAGDDMTAWAAASAAEKSGLADEIMSRPSVPGHVSRSELLECLDLASSVSGHGTLPISEVAEACLNPSGPGDQARMGTTAGRTPRSDEDPATADVRRSSSDARHG